MVRPGKVEKDMEEMVTDELIGESRTQFPTRKKIDYETQNVRNRHRTRAAYFKVGTINDTNGYHDSNIPLP